MLDPHQMKIVIDTLRAEQAMMDRTIDYMDPDRKKPCPVCGREYSRYERSATWTHECISQEEK